MKTKNILTLTLILAFGYFAKAQNYSEPAVVSAQEAYMQLDRSFYLSGDKLWFSLFSYDSNTGKLIKGRRFMSLTLLDRTGEPVLKERVKIEDGTTSGQLILPLDLQTDEYVFHLGYMGESADQFVFRKKLEVYNRAETLAKASGSDLSFDEPSINAVAKSENITIDLSKSSFGSKEQVEVGLNTSANSANLSVVVKPIGVTGANILSKTEAYEELNLRSNKPLNLVAPQDHSWLLFDLAPKTMLAEEARPYVFIPESRKVKGFFRIKDGIYSIDLTDISGGDKSFYFNQFSSKPYIPPTAEWDYEKEKYKDNLVPYFEGEMQFEWKEADLDYAEAISDISFAKPNITSEVLQYAMQKSVLESLVASGGYDAIPVPAADNAVSTMTQPTLFYKKASDYEAMNNMAEYLYEIVTGIKAWDRDNRKDIRVMFVGGMYHDSPLFLVDGIPTRDVDKILNIPIENVQGAGVIKDHKAKAQYKYNNEVLPYGAFAGSGIVVINLKPGAANPFRVEYDKLLKKRVYIKPDVYPNPDYSQATIDATTPDFRSTLYWNPQLVYSNDNNQLSFYTSDVPGKYEIIVQGITAEGQKVFAKQYFTVVGGIE